MMLNSDNKLNELSQPAFCQPAVKCSGGEIRTARQVIQDTFGKCDAFTYEQVEALMNIYSSQFKYVKTTCGKLVEFDDYDYHVLREHNLFIASRSNVVMVVFVSKNGNKTSAPVAKLLLGVEGNYIIHYKDGNTLNLKRDNLEAIQHQVAHFKQKKPNPETATSKYKGVSWNKFAKKWSASIKLDYQKKHLGYFKCEEDAALAYNAAAIELFGKEYAQLNVVP